MPFELNIRAASIDASHLSLDIRRGEFYEKGNIISIKPYGWSSHPTWSQSKYPYANNGGLFCTIVCPDGPTPAEIKNALWDKEWKDNLVFEIVSVNPAQGRYTVKVTNSEASLSGKNALVAAKIESFLFGWGCTNISFSQNAVQFTIALWDAVRSTDFWDVPLIGTLVNFSLVSYASSTGIGRIQVEIKNQDVIPDNVAQRIIDNGGKIISFNYPNCIFDIHRDTIRERFVNDVKSKVDGKLFRRRRFTLPESLIDQVIAIGGRMEVGYATLLSYITDGFNE